MYSSIILDQEIYEKEFFSPFALTDLLSEAAGKKQQTFLHFWQCKKTVILGMKDTRAAFFQDGIQTIRQMSYQPVVRNSGGLGIVSDEGILNISLIFPQDKEKKISIDEGYEKMTALTRAAFPETHAIEAFEVPDSYCPGKFDLSIGGKKFAGIAQRRVKEGVAVMIYLSVNGDQSFRGNLMKDFYQSALKEQFGTNGYPPVAPEKMANLEELLGFSLSIEEVKERFTKSFTALYGESTTLSSEKWRHDNVEETIWQQNIERMKERNSLLEEE
jgi:octanoyl-[GcvH]:protein N-octanoyltransferase